MPNVPSTRIIAICLASAGIVLSSLALLPPALAAVSVALGGAMVAIAAIDSDRYIIPDWLSLPAIPAGLLVSGGLMDGSSPDLVAPTHAVGAAVGFAMFWLLAEGYRRWRNRDGIGFGDVKLAGAAGAWNGIDLLPATILLAAISALALVVAAGWLRSSRPQADMRVPFGAFLAPSIWVVWIAGVRLLYD